jgi:hypothetical protein
MITLDGPDVFATTIFCDDVRVEVGGKISLIGSYSDNMYVHGGFPFVLPKFGFFVRVVQSHRAWMPISKIVAFLPEDSEDHWSLEQTLPDSIHEAAVEEANADVEGQAHGVLTINVHFVVAPLVLKAPGVIKVRAVRGDALVRCGLLNISAPPSQS